MGDAVDFHVVVPDWLLIPDLAADMELVDLVAEVRKMSEGLEQGDAKTNLRIQEIEKCVNDLVRRVSRPGFNGERADEVSERADARALCITKHALQVPKNDGVGPRLRGGMLRGDDKVTPARRS
jgi:hypothetical protein